MNNITMRTIDYYDEDYEVIEVKQFDNTKFRMIKYGTGFYALQRCGTNLINEDELWGTIYISPKLDINTGIGSISEGKYDIACLFSWIEDNLKFREKDYWELKIQVGVDDFNSLNETIKREDGEILMKEIFKLNRLQKNNLIKYYNEEWNWKWILRINMIIWVIIIIVVFSNLYFNI